MCKSRPNQNYESFKKFNVFLYVFYVCISEFIQNLKGNLSRTKKREI